jgi:hypothetical protein
MYKVLCLVGLLLATFALTSGSKPADASASGLPSPVILARVSLTNQTAVIPTTTIFTPAQSGVYRVSTYLAQTANLQTGLGTWYLEFNWTDEAGAEQATPIFVVDRQAAPQAYGSTQAGDLVNNFTFRAIAGQPVSYSVTDLGSGAAGTYELFIVLERL